MGSQPGYEISGMTGFTVQRRRLSRLSVTQVALLGLMGGKQGKQGLIMPSVSDPRIPVLGGMAVRAFTPPISMVHILVTGTAGRAGSLEAVEGLDIPASMTLITGEILMLEKQGKVRHDVVLKDWGLIQGVPTAGHVTIQTAPVLDQLPSYNQGKDQQEKTNGSHWVVSPWVEAGFSIRRN